MDSIVSKIRNFQASKNCTLLGIGPMSKNCVDATIELSSEYNVPLFLIPSRRQIETESIGSGYSNNWTTEAFSEYVKQRDIRKNIILARDHGGPWQNSDDAKKQLSLRDAMISTKKSYEQDIEAGFQFIHIAPSEDISSIPSTDQILKRIFELYEFCYNLAIKKDKEINFEISVGKDSDASHSIEELEYLFTQINNFCDENKFKKPTFFAIRIGTEVKEDRNAGDFEDIVHLDPLSPKRKQISDIIDLCNQNNFMMKHHNTDYLSDDALGLHPKLGIHAANVAPEFGIIESKALIQLLNDKELNSELDNFISLAYNSKKWEKWLVPNSSLTKNQKAIVAGHYVFSTSEFFEIKNRITQKLNLDLDDYLKNSIKQGIKRYMKLFNLI